MKPQNLEADSRVKNLREQFDYVVAMLPTDLSRTGELEVRKDCIGLKFAGGSLFAGKNRKVTEFTLHVFESEPKKEYYCHYPIFNDEDGELDKVSLEDLQNDLSRFRKQILI